MGFRVAHGVNYADDIRLRRYCCFNFINPTRITMTPEQKYLFDLNGYLVVDDVLTPEELQLANEGVDKHAKEIHVRTDSLAENSPLLVGTHGRGELGGMQAWEEPYGALFRHFLTHPKVVPILHTILGKGFRLDHDMFLLTMDKGAEGFYFHGKAGPDWDTDEFYFHRNGKIYCGLSVVSLQLADVNTGDGGFAVLPGSHKANFTAPPEMLHYKKHQEHFKQVTCKAGSAVFFSEAITHGTLPWKSDKQRRALLTRYTRGNMAYVPVQPVRPWAGEREKLIMHSPSQQSRFGGPGLPEV